MFRFGTQGPLVKRERILELARLAITEAEQRQNVRIVGIEVEFVMQAFDSGFILALVD